MLSTAHLERELAMLKVKKAAGSDGNNSRLLKFCASQVSRIVVHIFSLILRFQKEPKLWKTSCVVLVAKTSQPSDLNHYQPVALTANLVKTLERMVLSHLHPLVTSFAYQPSIRVEDAVIFLT